MQSGKRYFSPQAGSKRKSQQPYFVDKRLTPRVKEYLASYEIENQADADEVVDYLQLTFQEYARKKRNSLRQSVEKVLNSLTAPGKKMKFQNESHQGDLLKRSKNPSPGKKFAAKPTEDPFDSQSTDGSEDMVEAKDTNMINNSMHLMYKKTSADNSMKSQGSQVLNTESDEMPNNTGLDEGTVSTANHGFLMTIDAGGFGKSNKMLNQAKMSEASTPAPSPTGSKSEKSDIEKPKLRRKQKDDTEKKQETPNKKGIKPSESNIKLSDIGGYELALEEVTKLLFHLKHPEVFQRLGVKPPRGFLLHGPPGCGKTLLANAIAGELQLPYYKLAATEIVSGVSGESEEKLRDLFAIAQETSPSIVFLDEIDAVAPNRESASKDMERRIVSQLLVCMDDLDRSDCDVLLIGATNRPDSLDPALRRAGRFDREICLGIPDKCARERILQVVCNGLRLSSDFDYEKIAALTPGFVGADLVSLTREAAMFAVKRIFETLRQSEEFSSIDANNQADVEKQYTKMGEEFPMIELSVKGMATAAPTPVSTAVVTAAATALLTTVSTAVPAPIPAATATSTAALAPATTSTALSWLKDQPSLTPKQLEDFFIEAEDFKQALSTVQPSAKREGFATVPDVSWDDIGALEDIRDELSLAILAPVRHSEEFSSLGIANPPGILLAGPPGCGKTLLAKAIANEAGINFISVKGPELLNMYVGESERAVRQVFQRARNSSPCVIFFDEIDALCPKRSDIAESSASSRVVNQLLTEMDGLIIRKQVFLMGATNRPDIIDPAILRPGRLDKILFVGLPSPQDRVKILQTITKFGTKPKFAADVVLTEIAHDPRCDRFSGADLAALVREASVQILKEFMKFSMNSQDGARTLELKVDHFEKAFANLRPSVSLEVLSFRSI